MPPDTKALSSTAAPLERAVTSIEAREQALLMPALTIELALQRREIIIEATAKLMKEGVDYGTISGSERPCLLQPGADKLANLFGLSIKYQITEHVKDWLGAEHAGEPFFYCEVRACAERGGIVLGEGIGSCNSWEARYRYRMMERTCPGCGKATIFKSKHEPGWFCWAKRGGCGATYALDDAAITSQLAGRKKNEEPYDLVNTVQKIGFKRCKVSVTINATSASEFFTQDLDDYLEKGDTPGDTPAPEGEPERARSNDSAAAATAAPSAGATFPPKPFEGQRFARSGKPYIFREGFWEPDSSATVESTMPWVNSIHPDEREREPQAPASAPPAQPELFSGQSGLPDEATRREIAGFLRAAYGRSFNEAKINDWIRQRVAKRKTPNQIRTEADTLAYEAEQRRDREK